MDTAMSQKNLEAMLDQAVREVTEQTAGVTLFQSGQMLGENFCTVHITFQKGFHTSLSLLADTSLLARMARNAIGIEELTSEDVEDFTKEYFNILCGKIAAILFRTTQVPARFSIPVLYHGRYEPADHEMQFVLTYSDDRHEGAQLIHLVPRSRDGDPSQDG